MPEKHFITLTLNCKIATGDGTKIICLNSDYAMRIVPNDCGTFTNAPVKKLIVRYGTEYREADIYEYEEDGQTYLQANLPPVERQDYVDIGVCGKEVDDPEAIPLYTSTSARYECVKSALCGTVVLKTDPILSALNVTQNGAYTASDSKVDGFYEVNVQVPVKVEESRTIELCMPNGNQIVTPAYSTRTMNEVVITKPVTLIPENIKEGVNIGGVIGSYTMPYYDGTTVIIDTDGDMSST